MIKKFNIKPVYYFVFSYVILWIILFEFILPVNNILPKPSVVILSFEDIWNDYSFLINYLSTVSVIYISIAAAYFLVKILSPYLKEKRNFITEFINSLEWFSEYLPGIAIGLLLIFWFPDSEYIEFLFVFASAFLSIAIKFQNESAKTKSEFIDSSLSLDADEKYIARKVIWQAAQPVLAKHLFSLHLYIWSILLAFEFMKEGFGLGYIFRLALEYRDLSAIFLIFVVTGITVYLGTLLINYIKNKFLFWSVN
jgi:ABC-type nitrate/sulfonate/bicarbonate transport system permease component